MSFDVLMFSGVQPGALTARHAKLYYYRPTGMYRIASHLRQHNISVKTIDYFSQMSSEQFDQVIDRYLTADTKLIGISATVLFDYMNDCFFGVANDEFKRRIDYIKSKNPSIKIMVGGGQITSTTTRMLAQFKKYIDFVSRGQGENTALAIYNHVVHNAPLTTTSIDPIKEVTDSVYSFDDFNNCRVAWSDDDTVLRGECVPIEIARGCVFKCKYCSFSLTGKKFNDWTKTEETIRDELVSNFENYGIQHYQFVDDLINDSQDKIDLLEKIIKGLPFKIYFSGFLRLDLLWKYPKMIDQLKDIGLVSCYFGIETINDASGKAVGKGLGKSRIEETLKLCYEKWQGQVHVEAHIILGLPKDTDKTGAETFEWGKEMHSQGLIHTLIFKPLSINISSGNAEIDRDPEKFGYKINRSESTTALGFSNEITVVWDLNGYTRIQASKDSDIYNSYFFAKNQLPVTNAFNAPHILSLMNKVIPEQKMIEIMTSKRKLSQKQLDVIEKKLEEFGGERIKKYFDKLLATDEK